MKKRIRILLAVAGIVILLAASVNLAFFDLQRINGQTFLKEADSPDGQYTVTAYLNNGGATTAFAVLCTVRNNKNGREKNIYWQYRMQDASITWTDNHTVNINGISLDVRKDTYDFRQDEKKYTDNWTKNVLPTQ